MRGSLPTASTNSWSVTLLWMTCCELQSIGIPTWPARDMGAALSCCAAAAATTRVVKRAKKSAFFIGVTSQCSRDLYKRGAFSNFLIMFADQTPVRANDFSQSAEDGPRMLPSI